MMKRLGMVLIGACMAALLLSAAGCSCSGRVDGPKGPASADEYASIDLADGRLMYSQGDMIVQLDSNATTGYGWTCAVSGTTVKTDMDEYLAPGEGKDGQQMAGEGGGHLFGFKADGSGEATITLTYAREWERGDDDKTVVIEATVEDGVFTAVSANESA